LNSPGAMKRNGVLVHWLVRASDYILLFFNVLTFINCVEQPIILMSYNNPYSRHQSMDTHFVVYCIFVSGIFCKGTR